MSLEAIVTNVGCGGIQHSVRGEFKEIEDLIEREFLTMLNGTGRFCYNCGENIATEPEKKVYLFMRQFRGTEFDITEAIRDPNYTFALRCEYCGNQGEVVSIRPLDV